MEINQLVKVTGKITTIMELGVGDVYKRLVTDQYQPDKILLGVVTDVYANGETNAISTLEYGQGFGNVEVTTKIFSGTTEVQIFPVSVEELKSRIGDLISTARIAEREANDRLLKSQNIVRQLEKIRDSEDIQAAKTSVVSE